mgnify:CR=1 FL=1
MGKSFDEIYEQIYKKNYEVVKKDEKKRRTWIIKTIAIIGLVIILMTIPLFMIMKRLFEGVNVLTTPIIAMPILGLTIICIIKILSKSGNFKDKKMFKLKVINPLIKNIDEKKKNKK